jgi:hypothetical protein
MTRERAFLGRRFRPAPVVVLQPAGRTFVDGGAHEFHEATDQMIRNHVNPIAPRHAVDVGIATFDASRVAREQKLETVGSKNWMPASGAKAALPAAQHVTVDDSLKRRAMGVR